MVIAVPVDNNLFRLGEFNLKGNAYEYSKMFECTQHDNYLDIISFADCDEFVMFLYELRLPKENPKYILVRLNRQTVLKGEKFSFLIKEDPNIVLGMFASELARYADYIDHAYDVGAIFQGVDRD